MFFVVLLAVLMPLVVVVIVLFVVFGLNRKGRAQHPGWQPQLSPGGAAQPGSDRLVMGRGVWNAQVFGGGLIGAMGGTLNSTFGRFILEGGTLAFLPDGADDPVWSVPCTELFFTFNGSLGVAAVELRGPMGQVRCDVSVEHINRFTRNSFKSLREGRHARGFVTALVANGARGA